LIRYVVDASVAVKWFLDEPGSEAARLLLEDNPRARFVAPNELLAPAILPIEVRYVLGKQFNKGAISIHMLVGSLGIMRKIFGSFAPIDDELLDAASALSFKMTDGTKRPIEERPTFGIYDCLYIALAFRSDAELITADRKQAELAWHHGAKARLI
jgi:predicted nucleic acid-binding protein